VNDKDKIAHLNAERLLGFGKSPALRGAISAATGANDARGNSATALRHQR
jgi:hypothetical protein